MHVAEIADDVRTHLMSKRLVAVDVETTGLSPKRGDRVIEIGAVAIDNQEIIEEFHSLVNVEQQVHLTAQFINGITNDMLIDEPKPEEVFPKFRKFIGESILIAHNAEFDIEFLRHEFGRLGFSLNNKCFCTLILSRAYYPRLRNYKLETVYKYLFKGEKSKVQQHRALGDARMVAQVWMKMVNTLNNFLATSRT